MGEIGVVGQSGDMVTSAVVVQQQQAQVGTHRQTGDFKRAFSDAMNSVISSSQVNDEQNAPPAAADEETKLRWAAQQLEVVFMQELFKGMRRMVPEGGLFEQSFSLQTYQEMLDAELAKNMAIGGGIGLSDVILKQLRG